MPNSDQDSRSPDSSRETLTDLEKRALQGTLDLVRRAALHFGIEIPEPTVRFDLRGRAAGQVRTARGQACLIRYNPDLLSRNPRDFLANTLAHEAAHLVAFRLFGPRVKPHGREWQSIMRLLGAEPRRCHDYDVEGLQTRRLRRYTYRCGCGSHQLTSIRHRRILEGRVYLCGQCGHRLEPAPGPEDSPER